jgi:hypothetical protein
MLAPSVEAQQTRTFSEDHCKYTLPANDWEWLDPKLAPVSGMKTLAFVKNQTGVAFILRVETLKPGEKPTANSFESFEAGFIKSTNMKKLAGTKINFKGQPAYQIDAELPGGMGTSVRLFYANNRLYVLNIVNGLGSLTAADSDAIYKGFDLTGQPQPVEFSGPGYELGRMIGPWLCIGFVVLVIYVAIKKRASKRPTEM